MMTKKHFKAIAEIINGSFGDDVQTYYAPSKLVKSLADYFAEENPNFNREKFLKACGVL